MLLKSSQIGEDRLLDHAVIIEAGEKLELLDDTDNIGCGSIIENFRSIGDAGH